MAENISFYKPEQVAELLQVDVRTVLNWLHQRDLPGVKIGRLWRIPKHALMKRLHEVPTGKEEIFRHTKAIKKIGKQHGVQRVWLFGSWARGDAREDSDVDLMVELEPSRSLLDLGRLKMDLEQLLKRRVDLVEPESLRSEFKQSVWDEAVEL